MDLKHLYSPNNLVLGLIWIPRDHLNLMISKSVPSSSNCLFFLWINKFMYVFCLFWGHTPCCSVLSLCSVLRQHFCNLSETIWIDWGKFTHFASVYHLLCFFVLFWGPLLAVLRMYFWQCLGAICCARIKPGFAACKASPLHSVLLYLFFIKFELYEIHFVSLVCHLILAYKCRKMWIQ